MTITLCYTVSSGEKAWNIEVCSTSFDSPEFGCEHSCVEMNQLVCGNVKALEHYTNTFSELASFSEMHVTVEIEGIRTETDTTAQRFLSSLAGLIIALNSHCPMTKILRPMVQFHRPFMGFEESTYRSLANAALIHSLSGTEESLSNYIEREYGHLHELNKYLIQHFQQKAPQAEPLVNALVNLDLFVKEILFNAKQGYPDVRSLIG